MKISRKLILRTPTNVGEKCKQTFYVLQGTTEMKHAALIVRKLVITDNIDMYIGGGFNLVRKWKGKYVMRQVFSIKLKTLSKVNFFIKNQFN